MPLSLVGETPLSSAARLVTTVEVLVGCLALKDEGGHLSLEFREQVGVRVCPAEGTAEHRPGGEAVGRDPGGI